MDEGSLERAGGAGEAGERRQGHNHLQQQAVQQTLVLLDLAAAAGEAAALQAVLALEVKPVVLLPALEAAVREVSEEEGPAAAMAQPVQREQALVLPVAPVALRVPGMGRLGRQELQAMARQAQRAQHTE